MRIIFHLLFLSLSSMILAEECVIPVIQEGSIEAPYSAGENVTVGTAFNVSCNTRYQLNSTGVTQVLCVEGQMPTSCRELTVSLSNTVAGEGESVTVSCIVNSHDTVDSIAWYKDGVLFREQGGALTATDNTYRHQITFECDVADAGEYACYANINNTFNLEKYTGSTDLTVLGVTMSPTVATYYPLIGETLPFTCNFTTVATQTLSIVWKMGPGTIINIYEEDYGAVKSSMLTIKAKSTYSNNYTCTGTYKDSSNKLIVVSKGIEAQIRGYTVQPVAVVVGIGDSATFTCAAVGEKEGVVVWKLNDAPLTSVSSGIVTTYSNRETKSVLSMTALARQISEVKCSMQYADTILESDVVGLKVLGLGFVSTPSDTAFVKGTDNTLHCVVYNEDGISTQLEWYKGSSNLDTSRYTTTKNTTHWSSVLHFTTVADADAGDYSCKVKYYVDSAWKEFQSTPSHVYIREVRFRPDTAWSLSISESDTKVFTCFYLGDGAAGTGAEKVTWYINNVNVKGASGFDIDEGSWSASDKLWTSKLTVTNIRPDAAGKVECKFDCGVGGSIGGDSMLYVHRYSPLPATTLTTSYDSNLTCSVRTNEAANVAWNEDGTFVGINHNNFKALAASTTNYTQVNILEIKEWTYTKSAVTITCKYSYDVTDDTYQTQTVFLFKGFVQSPDAYSYYPPQEVTLNCDFGYSISTSAPSEILWKKDGTTIQTGDRYTVTKKEQSGMVNNILKIAGTSDVINQDSGEYECSFKFSDSEIYTRKSKVYFYTLSTLPATTQFYDSSALTLTCSITSKGVDIKSATWVSGGQELGAPGYTTEVSGSSTTLTINNVVESVSGTFSCKMVVEGTTLEDTATIEIRNIKMLSEDYKTVATGDSVTLSCSVKNYTAVTLKWYKGTTEVSGSTQQQASDTSTSTLTIASLQDSDLGTYKCGIESSRSIKSTTLSSASITSSGTVSTEPGSSATLTCTISGISSNPSSVYWVKTGSSEQMTINNIEDEFKVTVGTDSKSTTLTLNNVTEAAQYTCSFVVGDSTSYRSSNIIILYIDTTESTVYKGTAATLQCVVKGATEEPSIVKWSTTTSTAGYNITTGSFVTVDSSQSSTLVTTNTTVASQTFTCTFTIQGQEYRKSVVSHVYELTSLPRTVVHRGDNLTLATVFVSDTLSYDKELVKDLVISSNTSMNDIAYGQTNNQTHQNGEAGSHDLELTYSKVIAPMMVTFAFKDNKGEERSLDTEVYIAVFEAPKVAVSDGSETILSCNLKGLYTTPANVTWNNGALPTTSVYNAGELDTTYAVTNPISDLNYTCTVDMGFGTSISHYAVLDVFSITAPVNVTLVANSSLELNCTLSDLRHDTPTRVIWYRDSEQMLIQSLTFTAWPVDVISTLSNVTKIGNYRCLFDVAGKDYSKDIRVTMDNNSIVDPPDSSGVKLGVALGVAIPLVIILLVGVIAGLLYCKKKRSNSYPVTSQHAVKSLDFQANYGQRPSSLVYHNQTPSPRAEAYNPPSFNRDELPEYTPPQPQTQAPARPNGVKARAPPPPRTQIYNGSSPVYSNNL